MDIRSSYDHNSVKFQNSLYDKYEKGAKRCVGTRAFDSVNAQWFKERYENLSPF